MTNEKSDLWVDLFCGAGGLSTGAHLQGKKIIACVNHDAKAIESHLANHPEAVHLTEDIRDRTVIPKLKSLIAGRKFNLWASLECTSFSAGKGGQARDEGSRTLATFLLNYIVELNPESIWIENVRQFRNWCRLDENGHEDKRYRGEYYKAWVKEIESLGYKYNSTLLNGVDYGSHQSRTRYFAQFKRQENFVWPERTHGKEEGLLPYNKALDILELDKVGESIFDRKERGKKDLVDKTLKRLYGGLVKFHGEPLFLDEYYGNGSAKSVHKPIPVVPTKDRYSLIESVFIDQQFGTSNAKSANKPLNAVTTIPKYNVCYIMNPQFKSKGSSVNKPFPTVIARQDKSPLGLITGIEGNTKVQIKPGDSYYMRKIKKFCNENGISDLRRRPLTILELKRAQGFPDDYILKGTQTEQKKFIGNAVDVTMAKAIMAVA